MRRAERAADIGAVAIMRAGGQDLAGAEEFVAWTASHLRHDYHQAFFGNLRAGHAITAVLKPLDVWVDDQASDHGSVERRSRWIAAAIDDVSGGAGARTPAPDFVGQSDDFHLQQRIRDCWMRAVHGSFAIGWPYDNGGGVFVHRWTGGQVQDFRTASGGTSCIALQDGAQAAFWVSGAIWATYASGGGADNYGYPLGEEHDVAEGRAQSFEKATLVWNRQTGRTVATTSEPGSDKGGRAADGAYLDPMDRDNGKWVISDHSYFRDGAYRMTGWATTRQVLGDGLAQVDTEWTSGPERDGYGLVIKRQDVPSGKLSGYEVYVYPVGRWTLARHDNGEITDLAGFPESDAIRCGPGAQNTVGVICRGGEMTVLINGRAVGTVTDGTYAQGAVGVFTGSKDVEAAFRNLKIDPNYRLPSDGQTVAQDTGGGASGGVPPPIPGAGRFVSAPSKDQYFLPGDTVFVVLDLLPDGSGRLSLRAGDRSGVWEVQPGNWYVPRRVYEVDFGGRWLFNGPTADGIKPFAVRGFEFRWDNSYPGGPPPHFRFRFRSMSGGPWPEWAQRAGVDLGVMQGPTIEVFQADGPPWSDR
jgi:hypothetical protein